MKHETFSLAGSLRAVGQKPASNHRFYRSHGKRVFDVALALVLLPLIAPVVMVLWLLVRSEGPTGFYGHKRVGQNGKIFRCFKIRTMVPDAEQKLAAYLASNPEAAAEWAAKQKLENDPRTTRLGRFLRRTSLDELPQIWNVLRGDMSFVGPRPVTLPELERYGRCREVYLSLKPGITGIWQVKGRESGDYAERVRMDRRYSVTQSAALDVYLIGMTGLTVMKLTGR